MKIQTGIMPHPDAFLIPVGSQHGNFHGYVAHVVTPPQSFAGVGEFKGDHIHFSPEAWDSQPSTPRTAYNRATERARLEDWVDSVLPDDLYPPPIKTGAK